MAKAHERREREHRENVIKLANTYARAFNGVVERRGLDMPLELLLKLIELFQDAIYTGEALQRDYGQAASVGAVDPSATNPGTPSTRV